MGAEWSDAQSPSPTRSPSRQHTEVGPLREHLAGESEHSVGVATGRWWQRHMSSKLKQACSAVRLRSRCRAW